MLLLAGAAWNAQTFPDRARVFPQLIAVLALLLCAVELIRQISRGRAGATDAEPAARPRTWAAQFRLGVPYLVWIGALYLAMYTLGFLPASFLFVPPASGVVVLGAFPRLQRAPDNRVRGFRKTTQPGVAGWARRAPDRVGVNASFHAPPVCRDT
jgi:hypothetical protein